MGIVPPIAFNARCQNILETCEPFLISYRDNWGAFDLNPFGVEIPKENLFDPTTLRSKHVVDGLHHLDSFTFGDQDMLMPRWVLFDCGSFPGVVFGFGRRAKNLDAATREAYHVAQGSDDDVFVPLSMWVAIRCAQEGAWFGHNLSSANLILPKEHALPSLATMTKAFGIVVAKASVQYGATQWDSSSLNVHLSMGEMEILNAVTPAHTHHYSFTYRIPVDIERLTRVLKPDWQRPQSQGDRTVMSNDLDSLESLHRQFEEGLQATLTGVDKKEDGVQQLWLTVKEH